MSKSILLSRAVAPATAALGACLLAFASPASAFTAANAGGSENEPLHLGTSTGAAHAGASSSSSGGASIVRTIVGLAIVIAVIWGLAWILRQVKAGRDGGRDSNPSSAGLASVAALTLGSGRSVHLVRAGSDYVLLGSTEHGVAPIHRYTEEQAREAGLLSDDDAILQVPGERSRMATIAGHIVAGTGRVIGQGAGGGQGAFARRAYLDAQREADSRLQLPGASPVVGPRPDPMRMPSPSSGLVERLREMTVRR
jgi:flagellar protein FliO/FliZ